MPHILQNVRNRRDVALIIEDDHALRRTLCYQFEAERIPTVAAADGLTGITLMRQHRPLVLVLDLYLPHVSGFEIVDELRRDPECHGSLVIAITGMAEDEEDIVAMRGKADIIMTKPVDHRRLVELARAALTVSTDPALWRRRLFS
jgi:two-component system cell cycle response regulator DivK